MTKRWYVARVKPNCDRMAYAAMTREGFELFFPQLDIPVQSQQPTRVPMFPGYLFLRCDILGDDLPVISRLPGVSGWLRIGAEIPQVPDSVVQRLRARVEVLHGSGGMWERFKTGQLVRVTQGKLDGLATVLVEPQSPDDRVRVLLEFMGRNIQTTVPWYGLEPIPQDQTGGRPPRRGRRTRGRGRWIDGVGPRAVAHT